MKREIFSVANISLTVSFQFTDRKKRDLGKSIYTFKIIILIILFSYNLFRAQHHSTSNEDAVKITVLKGVKLYSIDKSFNKQVIEKKIFIENVDNSIENVTSNLILIGYSLPSFKTQNLAQQVKAIEEEKKQIEGIRQIIDKIKNYEAKSKSLSNEDYYNSPPQSHFFSSYSTLKDHLVLSQSNHIFSKFYISSDAYFVSLALCFPHTLKCTYNNSKSLGFFSLRYFMGDHHGF